MAVPFHTPYDGSSKPFTLALSALDPADWIEMDDLLGDHLRQKDELFASQHAVVFQAAADTLPAQAEVLQLLLNYLPERYPGLYELAARLVQDDLVLMRKQDGEHKLVAAADARRR